MRTVAPYAAPTPDRITPRNHACGVSNRSCPMVLSNTHAASTDTTNWKACTPHHTAQTRWAASLRSVLRPDLSGLNPADVAWVDFVGGGNRGLASLVRAYGRDLLCRQTGVTVPFAKRIAPLLDRILVVRRFAPSREMGRVHAGGIVAGVHDDQPRRYRTVGHFERVAMGSDSSLTIQDHDAVTKPVPVPGPLPAPARSLVDSGPEHVGRTELGMVRNGAFLPLRLIVLPAKPSRYRNSAAYGAGNFITRMIGQIASPLYRRDNNTFQWRLS